MEDKKLCSVVTTSSTWIHCRADLAPSKSLLRSFLRIVSCARPRLDLPASLVRWRIKVKTPWRYLPMRSTTRALVLSSTSCRPRTMPILAARFPLWRRWV